MLCKLFSNSNHLFSGFRFLVMHSKTASYWCCPSAICSLSKTVSGSWITFHCKLITVNIKGHYIFAYLFCNERQHLWYIFYPLGFAYAYHANRLPCQHTDYLPNYLRLWVRLFVLGVCMITRVILSLCTIPEGMKSQKLNPLSSIPPEYKTVLKLSI